MLARAAADLAAAGELPVNVRFACDSEEETGGHQIVDFLAADDRGADAAMIFDSGMATPRRAGGRVATRGLVYFHVSVRTGERDLHSGVFGGAALNAVHALTQILGAVQPRDGRLAEPLRAGIVSPTDRGGGAAWGELVPGIEAARRGGRATDRSGRGRGVLPAHDCRAGARRERDRRAARRSCRRRCCRCSPRPTSRSGWRPARTWRRSRLQSERLMREAAPAGAELEVTRLSSAPPALWSRPTRRRCSSASTRSSRRWARDRCSSARAARCRSSRRSPTRASRRSSAALRSPESNIHSPNERLLAEYVPLGIEVSRQLFRSLARL